MDAVEWRSTASPPRVELVDTVSGRRCLIETSSSPTLADASVDRYPFPVEFARTLETAELRFQDVHAVFVRDATTAMVDEVHHAERVDLPRGEYFLEVAAPLKLYLQCRGPLTVLADTERTTIAFEEDSIVGIATRATLSRPTGRVTIPPDVEGAVAGLSALGTGLQSRSPERSYPSLRGHPPELRLGEELGVPEDVDRETTVELGVEPDWAQLCAVAPLAYYLDASVVLAERPYLATAGGWTQELPSSEYPTAVERLLATQFLCDAIVRTEGLYRSPTAERAELEAALVERLELPLAELYGRPLAKRVERYAAVPFELVAPTLPRWPTTVFVRAGPERLPALPSLAQELAFVRPDELPRHSGTEARGAALSRFMQLPRSTDVRGAASVFEGDDEFVDVPDTDSLQQAWLGEALPLNANAIDRRGYRNRQRWAATTPDELTVAIVCNDAGMNEEYRAVESSYDSRPEYPFDLAVHSQLRADELATLLESDVTFLHFIGHATADGLECPGGVLDAADLEMVGIKGFFLNACQSYDQGTELVAAGAFGGIVTLSDVNDTLATSIGTTAAGLLNAGFSFAATVDVIRRSWRNGGQYQAVGDPQSILAVPSSGIANLCHIVPVGEATFRVAIETFPARGTELGSTYSPFLGPDRTQYLAGTTVGPFTVTADRLRTFLDLETIPVLYDGELEWSTDVRDRL